MDYFEEIEKLILRLKYPRDLEMTLDQILAGLKPHICTQFIGVKWTSLNQMKSTIIPYDSAHWEINKASGGKTGTCQKSEATNTQSDRGKSKTPQVKTEVAKAGGSEQRRYLKPEEFQKCKDNHWCFKCKADGLEIVGSARYHPNHLPQNIQKNQEKKEKTKIAATKGKEKESDSGSESDTDCEQSKN